jgi:hypothetical protein
MGPSVDDVDDTKRADADDDEQRMVRDAKRDGANARAEVEKRAAANVMIKNILYCGLQNKVVRRGNVEE